MSTVAATTKEIKTSTKYTYDHTRLAPLAMAGAVLPDAENFAARPDWINLVARSALKILINTIMIGVKNRGDNLEFVRQVLKNIQAARRDPRAEQDADALRVFAAIEDNRRA